MLDRPIDPAEAARHDAALRRLADWAVADPWRSAGAPARLCLRRAVQNLLAAAAAGSATAEHRALLAAWDAEPGAATLLGGGTATVEAAAWLNGVAAVALERDEGNRHSKGHPAVQTSPAALALAERRGIGGERLWNALLIGYEVAARFGAATDFAPGVHTHGVLGGPGAAAACAVLLGLDADGVERAIRIGCALPVATNWGVVLAGSPVRDQWIGAVNVAGLAAARSAAAGDAAPASGTLPRLGGTLGELDPQRLTERLGERLLMTESYLKQHGACAYTHASADAAVILHRGGLDAVEIEEVLVESVAATAALRARSWTTRHGAYFSTPFAVASALLHGDVAPHRASVPAEPALADLAGRVRVVETAFPAASAGARPARVTVRLRSGASRRAEVAHPDGDAVVTPFDEERVAQLLDELLAPIGGDRSTAGVALAALDRDEPGAVRKAFAALTTAPEGTAA